MKLRPWSIICITLIFLVLTVSCGDQNNNKGETPMDINEDVETPITEENNETKTTPDQNENNKSSDAGDVGKVTEPELTTPSDPLTTSPRQFQVNTTNFLISPTEPTVDEEKFVLLTIDDTPTGKSTNQILDILDEYNAKAIFFVNGHYAKRNLELLKEIKNRGHIIGNHTWWHIYIRKESPETVHEEIVGLSNFIEEHLGERPVYFRPPFGQNSDVSLKIIKEEGMQTMNWSNGSLDWELKTPEAITKQVMDNIKNGDNILFHDKQITADALKDILPQLQNKGFQFVLPTEVKLSLDQ
jgi:peptidoglycan/xylan/chitin deacetylase (PgdA/CDA1 family)